MWIGTAAALVAVVVGTLALLQTFGRGHGTAPRASIYAHASGTVSFFDVGGSPGDLQSDALLVNVNGLPVPASGSSYQVWFVDRPDETATNEGTLAQANNAWTLQNPAPDGPARAGPNLLAFSPKALAAEYVEVTLEAVPVHVPTGPVVLSVKIPPLAFTHVQHLLVAFPSNPGGTGYLVGMMQYMQTLDNQTNSLQDKFTRNLPGAAQCATQNIINIIEGSGGPHFKNLSAFGNECSTFGIAQSDARLGLDVVSAAQPGWVQGVEDHVNLAINQSDATKLMKMHGGHVLIACEDLLTWLGQLDGDAVSLVNSGFHQNQVGAQVQALVALEHKALHGTTLFGEEEPQPIKGEFGAVQAYIHGQFLATLQVTPAS